MKKHLDQLVLSGYINVLKNRYLVETYEKLHESINWETDHPLPAGKITPAAKNTWIQVFSNPSFQYMQNAGLHVVKKIGDTGTTSEHTYGNAIDIAGTASEMQELADWLVSNASSLSVNNVIYNKRIWNSNQGWHAYNWKAIGGTPHTDHVHVDFYPTGGGKRKIPKDSDKHSEEASEDILSVVTSFGIVKAWILNRGGREYIINGESVLIYPDAKLGKVVINPDGDAFIESSKKQTTWKFYKKLDKTYELHIGNETAVPKTQKLDTSLKKYQTDADNATNRVLDQIQTTLDWLGWIPGFGDIIDAINSVGYFARGKTLDGVLSLIAVVPIVGTAASKAVKGAIKTFPGDLALILKNAAKSGDPTELAKFWKHAIESGRVDKATLQSLAKYGDELAILLTSGKRKILESESELRMLGIDAKAVGKQIDEVAAVIRNTYTKPMKEAWYSAFSKAIGKNITSVAKGIAKIPVELAKTIFNVSANIVTLGTYNFAKKFLKKLNPGAIENTAKLVKALDVTFKKKMMDSPAIVTALIKQEGKEFPQLAKYKTTNGINLQDILDISTGKSMRKFKNRVKKQVSKQQAQAASLGLHKELSKLKKTNPSEYTKLVNDIHSVVTKSGNPYYRLYVNNSTLAAMHAFKPGAMFQGNIDDSIKNLAKNFSISNPKALDVISNEIEDIGERLGFDPQDDPQSVIVASVVAMVNYLSSDRYLENDKSKESNQGGTFNKMKQVYDNTPGSTSDKLRALADAGFTEIMIQAFTKQQGK